MRRKPSNTLTQQAFIGGEISPSLYRIGILIIVVSAACLMLVMIIQFGRAAPINDEILPGNGADVAIKTARGELQLADLLRDYRGYLLVPTRIINVINTVVFGYDVRLEMLIFWALICMNVVILWQLLQSHLSHAPRLIFISLAPMALLMFSIRQSDGGFVFGQGTSQQFVLLFQLIGYLIISKMRLGWPLIGRLSVVGVLASLSVSGYLCWGLFTILVWMKGERSWLRWLVFLGIGSVTTGVILLSARSALGSTLSVTTSFVAEAVPAFALEFLGSPFVGPWWEAHQTIYARVFGIFGLVLFLFLVFAAGTSRQKPTQFAAALWACQGLLGIASAVLAAAGRAGRYWSVAPHYTIWANCLWVGIIGLTAVLLAERRYSTSLSWFRARIRSVGLASSILIMLSMAALQVYWIGIYSQIQPQNTSAAERVEECLWALQIVDKCGEPFLTTETAQNFFEYRLNVFRHPTQPNLSTPLTSATLQVMRGQIASELKFDQIPLAEYSVARLVSQGDATARQTLKIPTEVDGPVVLQTAIAAEQCIQGAFPQQIRFTLSLISANAPPRSIFEGNYGETPAVIRYDLTSLKGQTIQLEYETSSNDPIACYLGIWENPRLILNMSQP